MIWTCQPGCIARLLASIMAMLYGSWPLEQPADQIVILRSRARLTSSSGRMCAERASNGRRSRNHEVSFVVIASTTSACRAVSGEDWRRATRSEIFSPPSRRASGVSRDSTRYSLPGSSTMAERRHTSWAM